MYCPFHAVSGSCNCPPLSGWWGEYCEVPGCPRHPDTYEECSDHGECNSEKHECDCRAGWTGAACHVTDCPGEPDCSGRGDCDGVNFDPPRCVNCSSGWMGAACEEPCLHGQQVPPDSGNCQCEEGWAGVGCNSECSGNGRIVGGRCECDYDTGWKGRLCDVPGCPGLFNLDCSGRGEFDCLVLSVTCDAEY